MLNFLAKYLIYSSKISSDSGSQNSRGKRSLKKRIQKIKTFNNLSEKNTLTPKNMKTVNFISYF